MAKRNTGNVTHAQIRMYRMGTGDCFVVKFFKNTKVSFTMMIDCGVCSGSADHLTPYIKDIKKHIGKTLDLLVITHEHKDHVYGFEACEALWLSNFTIKSTWMGWTENDGDRKVSDWKREYGEKKKALAMVSEKLSTIVKSRDFKDQFAGEANGDKMVDARKNFTKVLNHFSDLHAAAANGVYKGMLKGMEVVKTKLAGNIEYFKPGDVVEKIDGLEGIRFFVLGPPLLHKDIKQESGGKGETYDHNKELATTGAFAAAVRNNGNNVSDILPFEEQFILRDGGEEVAKRYADPKSVWRKIDYDWYYSAGSLALRMNSLTNNLSLALAIEFQDSGKVMLFPGDAEYGSWASWYRINWKEIPKNKDKHFTEELLNRTVFYKVAHHLSHNGTARKIGMDKMTNDELVAMATLDYDVIGSGWSGTMPNRALLKDLLTKTKGRLIVMNEKGLFYDIHNKEPLSKKIKEARSKMNKTEKLQFEKSLKDGKLYWEFTVKA